MYFLNESEEDNLKISIKYDPNVKEPELTIVCRAYNDEISEMLSCVSLVNNTVSGVCGEETYFIPLSDILYFESVDGKIFFYTADNTYETSIKMYRLEEKFENTPFSRISKSMIVNLRQVKSIKAEKNSRMSVALSNGERVIVSRQYLNNIREKLGVK